MRHETYFGQLRDLLSKTMIDVGGLEDSWDRDIPRINALLQNELSSRLRSSFQMAVMLVVLFTNIRIRAKLYL